MKRDPCSRIWKILQPLLTPHIRKFAENTELLRKFSEDSQANAKLRQAPVQVSSLFGRDIDKFPKDNFDSDIDDHSTNLDKSVSIETLIAAYHSIAKIQDRERSSLGDTFLLWYI